MRDRGDLESAMLAATSTKERMVSKEVACPTQIMKEMFSEWSSRFPNEDIEEMRRKQALLLQGFEEVDVEKAASKRKKLQTGLENAGTSYGEATGHSELSPSGSVVAHQAARSHAAISLPITPSIVPMFPPSGHKNSFHLFGTVYPHTNKWRVQVRIAGASITGPLRTTREHAYADLEYCRAAPDQNEFAARLHGLTCQGTNEDTTTSPASTSVPYVSSPLDSQL